MHSKNMLVFRLKVAEGAGERGLVVSPTHVPLQIDCVHRDKVTDLTLMLGRTVFHLLVSVCKENS